MIVLNEFLEYLYKYSISELPENVILKTTMITELANSVLVALKS